ncbi:hypothetical protein O181_024782 [Austropuccinia psidii MF-1]|uniref:Uncharacterized protein n=1 Tax=Austropuccinia psidii MF-1 TaxID=1389203 RepID=A0A9Q3GZ99_9BASI|nr:hypothetical protein [Austropuccinia psidii MF-1]
MPSTRLGASYNPSRRSQKGLRRDYGRSQSVIKRQGSVDDSQTKKSVHSEADDTSLPSKRAATTTRSIIGYIQSKPEGLKQCISAQRVPDPCRSVEKLHELLPDCEKLPGPSQHFQATQWMATIDGKEKDYAFKRGMEEHQPATTQESAKNNFSSQRQPFQH